MFLLENYTNKKKCGSYCWAGSWIVSCSIPRPTTTENEDVNCALNKSTGKSYIHAISVSDTSVWNIQLSYVKTALVVTIQAKTIFVVEIDLHFLLRFI